MGVRGEDVKDEVSVDGEIGDVQMYGGGRLAGRTTRGRTALPRGGRRAWAVLQTREK